MHLPESDWSSAWKLSAVNPPLWDPLKSAPSGQSWQCTPSQELGTARAGKRSILQGGDLLPSSYLEGDLRPQSHTHTQASCSGLSLRPQCHKQEGWYSLQLVCDTVCLDRLFQYGGCGTTWWLWDHMVSCRSISLYYLNLAPHAQRWPGFQDTHSAAYLPHPLLICDWVFIISLVLMYIKCAFSAGSLTSVCCLMQDCAGTMVTQLM